MTNEEKLELIAQARELCEEQSKDWQRVVKWHNTSTEDIIAKLNAKRALNSWTTHLAEMNEHQGVHTDYGYVCQKCSKSFSQNGMTISQYPCDFLLTKAKRLLGVE